MLNKNCPFLKGGAKVQFYLEILSRSSNLICFVNFVKMKVKNDIPIIQKM